MVTKRVSAAEAKAHLSSLSAEVAFGGQHVVIERHGVPMVALVSIPDLETLEQDIATSPSPQGALAIVGAWKEVGDDKIDALIEDIYEQRLQDVPRPVDLEL